MKSYIFRVGRSLFCSCFLLLLIGNNKAIAQAKECYAVLNILVEEQQGHAGIAGVFVSIAKQTAVTNDSGMATMTLPCKLKLNAELIMVDNLPAQSGDWQQRGDTLIVKLPAQSTQLKDVLVLSKRKVVQSFNAQSSLSTAELSRLRGKSIAEMASHLSGVSMMQTGSEIAKPMINGMSSNRILIVNNGVRQEGQQWGAEHAPEIDAMQVAQVAVVKGAEAIRYGRDAIGGVLLVSPESLPYGHKKLHTSLTLIGNSNSRKGIGDVQLESAFGKSAQWAWRAQGSASRGGNYQTPNYYLNNTGNQSLNYSAAIGYKKSRVQMEAFYSHVDNTIGIFSGAHIGDTLDLQQRIRNGRPFDNGSFSYTIGAPRQWVQHDLFKLNAKYDWNANWSFDAIYSFQYDRRREYDLRRQDLSALPSIDLKLMYQSLKAEAKYKSGRWNSILGVQGDLYVNNNTPDLHTTPIIPNYDSKAMGLYVIGKHIGDKVAWEAGLRFDTYDLNAAGYDSRNVWYGGAHNFRKLNVSLGMSTTLFPNLQWLSNLGSAWRPPTVNELYSSGLHHGAAQYELGDSSLKAEQSLKWSNAFKWQSKAKRLIVDLDVYAQYFEHYIYLNPSLTYVQSLRGAFPVFNYKSTQALFWGADLHFGWAIHSDFHYDVNASLIRAKDLSQDAFLPFIPSDRISHTLNYSSKVSNAIPEVGFWIKNDWVARQSRYEINSDYAAPPPGYGLLALGLSTTCKVKAQTINIQFSVENVLNNEYKDYLNRYRYYAHDIGRNFSLKINYSI